MSRLAALATTRPWRMILVAIAFMAVAVVVGGPLTSNLTSAGFEDPGADWVHARAVRMRDALLRAGYPVHGDPDSLLPVGRSGVTEPSDAGVLALAMRLLLEKGWS